MDDSKDYKSLVDGIVGALQDLNYKEEMASNSGNTRPIATNDGQKDHRSGVHVADSPLEQTPNQYVSALRKNAPYHQLAKRVKLTPAPKPVSQEKILALTLYAFLIAYTRLKPDEIPDLMKQVFAKFKYADWIELAQLDENRPDEEKNIYDEEDDVDFQEEYDKVWERVFTMKVEKIQLAFGKLVSDLQNIGVSVNGVIEYRPHGLRRADSEDGDGRWHVVKVGTENWLPVQAEPIHRMSATVRSYDIPLEAFLAESRMQDLEEEREAIRQKQKEKGDEEMMRPNARICFAPIAKEVDYTPTSIEEEELQFQRAIRLSLGGDSTTAHGEQGNDKTLECRNPEVEHNTYNTSGYIADQRMLSKDNRGVDEMVGSDEQAEANVKRLKVELRMKLQELHDYKVKMGIPLDDSRHTFGPNSEDSEDNEEDYEGDGDDDEDGELQRAIRLSLLKH